MTLSAALGAIRLKLGGISRLDVESYGYSVWSTLLLGKPSCLCRLSVLRLCKSKNGKQEKLAVRFGPFL
jgi:hypothetical protein